MLRPRSRLYRGAVLCPITPCCIMVFKPREGGKTRCHLKINETLILLPLNHSQFFIIMAYQNKHQAVKQLYPCFGGMRDYIHIFTATGFNTSVITWLCLRMMERASIPFILLPPHSAQSDTFLSLLNNF